MGIVCDTNRLYKKASSFGYNDKQFTLPRYTLAMTIRQRRGGSNTDNTGNRNTTVSAENNEAWNVLTDADFFFIKQRVDWEEAVTGIEVANQYFVFDERNVQQYEVFEHQAGCMDCLSRQFLKNQRPFTLFVSHRQKRWIKIVRNYTCWLQRINI